jgi:hypothetical protein
MTKLQPAGPGDLRALALDVERGNVHTLLIYADQAETRTIIAGGALTPETLGAARLFLNHKIDEEFTNHMLSNAGAVQ